MQGLVKGAKILTFLAGWRIELAGCRSTLSMSKIKVSISETTYRSFYKTLGDLKVASVATIKIIPNPSVDDH